MGWGGVPHIHLAAHVGGESFGTRLVKKAMLFAMKYWGASFFHLCIYVEALPRIISI
jgi:hypothetical protein